MCLVWGCFNALSYTISMKEYCFRHLSSCFVGAVMRNSDGIFTINTRNEADLILHFIKSKEIYLEKIEKAHQVILASEELGVDFHDYLFFIVYAGGRLYKKGYDLIAVLKYFTSIEDTVEYINCFPGWKLDVHETIIYNGWHFGSNNRELCNDGKKKIIIDDKGRASILPVVDENYIW